jgi:hypothetical protein
MTLAKMTLSITHLVIDIIIKKCEAYQEDTFLMLGVVIKPLLLNVNTLSVILPSVTILCENAYYEK